jgi:hypothetical protein
MRRLIFLLILAALAGCDEQFRQPWHSVTLPSGAWVKITSFNLAWDSEHDARNPRGDCFALEFVSNVPSGDTAAREHELQEVFDLMRPASESWGLHSATIARFPTVFRKGHYDLLVYTRAADGTWTHTREDRTVFANE